MTRGPIFKIFSGEHFSEQASYSCKSSVDYGVWDDDYDVFFQKRAEKISEELSNRLIPQPKAIANSTTGP